MLLMDLFYLQALHQKEEIGRQGIDFTAAMSD